MHEAMYCVSVVYNISLLCYVDLCTTCVFTLYMGIILYTIYAYYIMCLYCIAYYLFICIRYVNCIMYYLYYIINYVSELYYLSIVHYIMYHLPVLFYVSA